MKTKDFKEFIAILLKPGLKLFFGGFMGIVSAIVFFAPDWQPFLSWPTLSKFLAWYWWLILGLLVLWLATAWEAAKKISDIKKENNKNAEIKLPINMTLSNAGNTGHAYNLVGDGNIINPPKELLSPNIIAGISYENQFFVQKAQIILQPLPAKPDIENIIIEKRVKLLKKLNERTTGGRTKNSTSIGVTGADYIRGVLQASEDSYPSRVEDYLVDYKNYELKKYNASILSDRYRVIRPVLENRSEYPASHVIVELYLPENFSFPSNTIQDLRNKVEMWKAMHVDENYKFPPPAEPEFHVLNRTETIMSLYNSHETSKHIVPNDLKIMRANGSNIIEYHIENLIQNRPYTELLPIPIWLDNIDKSTIWHIPVKLYAKELRQPIESNIEIELVVEF